MRQRRFRLVSAGWLAVAVFGCAGLQIVNEPLESADPSYGYRASNTYKVRDEGKVLVALAFSGGGTRAAAFAYGVLEELRDTTVTIDGETLRLVDEIDSISGVSGGSFPAAYYGLYGDRIFEDFQDRFLNRNIQRGLVLQALRPYNLLRLFTPFYTRSIMASQYYDRKPSPSIS